VRDVYTFILTELRVGTVVANLGNTVPIPGNGFKMKRLHLHLNKLEVGIAVLTLMHGAHP
jgi:hypothetical protein